MSKMPANPTKDTIYIDVDDEITAIIDKVSVSPHKIVALVLPKRATMLQSIVNMKLLKRATDSADKHLVLVTNEQGLLPLAGAVGLHVAATPQSKPAIPKKPDHLADATDDVEEYDETVFSPGEHAAKPIGELAGVPAAEEETIQLDNADAPKAAAKAPKKPKSAASKKLKIPNFNSFRNRLLYGGAALVLGIVLLVFAVNILPKSTITIRTDSEEIAASLDVTFDTNATNVNVDRNVVPAIVEQVQKTTTQTAAASGQKNNGSIAEGSVTMRVRKCSPPYNSPPTVPSGTTLTSGESVVVTQESASFSIDGPEGGCIAYSSGGTDVRAQAAGTKFNVSNATFSVAGRSDVTASGTVKGGTDNIIKVLSQADIDGVKQTLAAQVDAAVKDELADNLRDNNLYVVGESFNTGTPEVTVSAKAGDQVDSVTVTQKTTYSLVGAKQSDLEQVIQESVSDEIDTDKQKVLKTGLDVAVFKLQNQQDNSSQVQMSLATTVLAGPKLDDEQIKEQVVGKKLNETKEIIQAYPGVTDVDVAYSPFWVSSNPKNTDKITITYEK